MPQAIFYLYTALVGLCMGSFANVLIYRLPRNDAINTPPSHCPACDKKLAILDLIPVISWLFLKRRCRYCGEKISARYPAVELSCALLFVIMAYYAGLGMDAIPLCLLAFVLLCVSIIDWDTQEIPDGLLIFGAVVGIIWVGAAFLITSVNLNAPDISDALLGVAAGALPLFLLDKLVLLLIKKDGFGFGDVKMMAMVGLFLGWQMTLLSFFFAFITGGVFAGFLLFAKRAEKGTYMPFGPFLAAGVLAAFWWGEVFLVWIWWV